MLINLKNYLVSVFKVVAMQHVEKRKHKAKVRLRFAQSMPNSIQNSVLKSIMAPADLKNSINTVSLIENPLLPTMLYISSGGYRGLQKFSYNHTLKERAPLISDNYSCISKSC